MDLIYILLVVGLAIVTSGYVHSTIILFLLLRKNEIVVGDVTILEPRRWVLMVELALMLVGWVFLVYMFNHMLEVMAA